jgi:ectoine hydroxylase-related dioxygenase (phytanoyl-CoA dioxygenase family)
LGRIKDGFAIVPGVVGSAELDELLRAIGVANDDDAVRSRGGVYAIRNLLSLVPHVREWTASPACRSLVAPLLGPRAFAVRGILFDKTPDAIWKVLWHQDLSIAVQEQIDVAGYGPWSTKAGVLHVQPPVSVLGQMLAVRLDLDDCGEENGPVRVIPGSHRFGRAVVVPAGTSVSCIVPRGGVLLMRPPLWHASSPAVSPAHRRVIHIEFAAVPLAGGLQWVS